MNIQRTSPSFKGLIYFPKERIAVNTDTIRTIREPFTFKDSTEIKFVGIPDGPDHLDVITDLKTVLKAYEAAARSKHAVVNVDDYK